MANEPVINTEGIKEATAATKEFSNTAKEATESAQNFGTIFGNVDSMSANAARSFLGLNEAGMSTKTMLGSIGEQLNKAKEYMNANTDASVKASLAFAGVTLAIAGTRKSFQEFQQSNVMLNTMSDPLNELIGILTKSGASANTTAAKLKEVGLSIPLSVISKGKDAIINFAKGIAESADNTLRLQSGLFQMSATTGSLNEVTSAAGDEFERMNSILSIHDSMIRATEGDTMVTAQAAEAYYMALGKVHGALGSTVTSARDSNEKVSMLSATMQYAAGSGRSQTEIIEDLQMAYKNMGMEGENALKFTARMGEISNKFGVELSVVRQSLQAATGDLMKFGGAGMKNGDIIQGAARLMNDYTQSLKNTGISGAAAIGIVQDMTNKIATLGVAERSFLSQRSGGAGGLRGAFQIENMIKEGNIDEVMKKVQSTMQQQFGKIVTGDEAAKSESAASRAIMQRQMLQQGPLGAFAKTEQDAARILEAFSARGEGKISEKELSDTIVQDTMDKGLKFQELTYTDIHAVRTMMETSRGATNAIAAGLVQQVGAARTGTRDYLSSGVVPEEEENRANLERLRTRFSRLSGQRAREIGNVTGGNLGAESGVGSIGKVVNEGMGGWSDVISSAPTALMAPIKRFQSLINSGDGAKFEEEYKALQERISEKQREVLNTRSESDKERLNAEIKDLTFVDESTKAYRDFIEAGGDKNLDSVLSPAATVQNAAQNASSVRSAEVAAATASEAEAAATTTTETTEPIDINLKIETTCVNCGSKINSSHQDHARLPIPKS